MEGTLQSDCLVLSRNAGVIQDWAGPAIIADELFPESMTVQDLGLDPGPEK